MLSKIIVLLSFCVVTLAIYNCLTIIPKNPTKKFAKQSQIVALLLLRVALQQNPQEIVTILNPILDAN